MKIRLGFVSNSSSSSFIVIDDSKVTKYIDKAEYFDVDKIEDIYIVGIKGELEFGWQVEKYYDMESKINFSYIQALTLNNTEWLNMLDEVIKRHLKVNIIDIDYVLEKIDNGNAYIDHASIAYAGDNGKMFDNEETLEKFLFNDKSYIQNDNDNY